MDLTPAALLESTRPSLGAIRLIAVDGPSAAGKSTFARRLAAALDAPLLGSDEFPVPWDGDPLAWWPRAEPLLAKLAAGRPATFHPYDWRTGDHGPAREIPVAAFLVLEGVGAAWRGCPAALRIWVDAPHDVRRRRAERRDGPAILPSWDAWSVRERHHFTTDGTIADLIVTPDSRPLLRERK
ncbi:(d)CMP kinase [Actinocorallia longicatena]